MERMTDDEERSRASRGQIRRGKDRITLLFQ